MKKVLIPLLLSVQPALGDTPYMWGAGPRVGMSFAPAPLYGSLGGEASLYVNRNLRMNAWLGTDFGKQRFGVHGMVAGEYIAPIQSVAFTAGGGSGIAHHWFRAEDIRRNVMAVPIRADVGILVRHGPREAHLRVFGRLDIPFKEKTKGIPGPKGPPGPSLLFAGGVEIAVLFGDFTPPRKTKGVEGRPMPVDDSRDD